VYAVAQAGDARKIELGAIPPEHMLKVKSPVTFTLNMNGAKGQLDGKVIAPSGTEDDAFISKIDDDQWSFRFIPHENGVYRLHIRFNGVSYLNLLPHRHSRMGLLVTRFTSPTVHSQ